MGGPLLVSEGVRLVTSEGGEGAWHTCCGLRSCMTIEGYGYHLEDRHLTDVVVLETASVIKKILTTHASKN